MRITNLCRLMAVVFLVFGCSDKSTGPGGGNTDTTPPTLTIVASHQRITTPGLIAITATANEILGRVEIYEGATKVGESVGSAPTVGTVSVTAAQNGTHSYTAKGYDLSGNAGTSGSVTVEVDIHWSWIAELGGTAPDEGVAVATDVTGALYVAGNTTGGLDILPGDHNAFLAKYDADGNRIWIRSFGGTNWEEVGSVGVDPSGRIYLSGQRYYPSAPLLDCFIALYDAAGNLVWSRDYNITPASAGGCYTTADASSNVYLVGSLVEGNSTQGRTDVFVRKYDRDGNVLWTKDFGSTPGIWNDDFPTNVAIDPQGGVYVVGYTDGSMDGSLNQGGRDIFLVKLDAAGTRIWARQFGGTLHDFPDRLAADPDGGVYIAGSRDNPQFRFGAFGDAMLARYNADGTQAWIRYFDGGHFDVGNGVAVRADAVYFVGWTVGGPGAPHEITETRQGSSDGFLMKLTRDGTLTSVRLLGGQYEDYARSVALGINGDVFIVGGTSNSFGAVLNHGQSDAIIARHRD